MLRQIENSGMCVQPTYVVNQFSNKNFLNPKKNSIYHIFSLNVKLNLTT